jgi:hypothetical protein
MAARKFLTSTACLACLAVLNLMRIQIGVTVTRDDPTGLIATAALRMERSSTTLEGTFFSHSLGCKHAVRAEVVFVMVAWSLHNFLKKEFLESETEVEKKENSDPNNSGNPDKSTLTSGETTDDQFLDFTPISSLRGGTSMTLSSNPTTNNSTPLSKTQAKKLKQQQNAELRKRKAAAEKLRSKAVSHLIKGVEGVFDQVSGPIAGEVVREIVDDYLDDWDWIMRKYGKGWWKK